MTKHPTARRVHRQDSDEDVFVAGVLETSAWARQHGRIITTVGVVLLVALAAGLYYRNYRAGMNNRAAAELTAVRQTVLDGNQQLAMRDLNTFVAKYGGTESGDEARVMLAQVYMEQNQPAKAIETIKPVADKLDKSVSGAMILAAAYEASKQMDKAEQTYLNIADKARFGFEKREALERAASIRLDNNNANGAAELYERALNTFENDNDPEKTVFEMRVAEAKAAAAARTKS